MREFIEDRKIVIRFVRSVDNESDVLMKNTSQKVYDRHDDRFLTGEESNLSRS